MICKECGNKIDDNSTFCKFCGYKVSAESSCQKAYLNTPTENSSAIKSKQVKKNIIISLSSIITVLTAIVLITVIIKYIINKKILSRMTIYQKQRLDLVLLIMLLKANQPNQ